MSIQSFSLRRILPNTTCIRRETLYFVTDVRVISDKLAMDINANTLVLKLLPTPLSIGYLVTKLLIQLLNSCADTATQITKEKQQ